MTLQELKNWVNGLPQEFLQFPVVSGEFVRRDEELDIYCRRGRPVTEILIDKWNKEFVILTDIEIIEEENDNS